MMSLYLDIKANLEINLEKFILEKYKCSISKTDYANVKGLEDEYRWILEFPKGFKVCLWTKKFINDICETNTRHYQLPTDRNSYYAVCLTECKENITKYIDKSLISYFKN